MIKPMALLANLLIGLVALEHLYFLYLEMFAWTAPRTLKAFGNTKEGAEATKVLAANQGLYNGFLAAGLFWSIFHPNFAVGYQLKIFFLLCVIIAAIYGGMTAKRSILFVQGGPALLALLVLFLTNL
jgi:putative membrane protein